MEFFDADIVDVKEIAEGFCKVVLKPSKTFEFSPGDYVLTKAEIEGKPVIRAYSIASPPSKLAKEGIIELGVKRVFQGKMSNYLCNLKPGSKISISDPKTGTLKFVESKKYVLIGIGSGISPLRSIALHVLETFPDSKVLLIHGNKTIKSTPFYDEFMILRNHNPNFEYVVVLSREQTEGAFYGHVQDYLKEHPEMINKDEVYYVCGKPEMVREVKELLLSKGIDEKNIFIEGY